MSVRTVVLKIWLIALIFSLLACNKNNGLPENAVMTVNGEVLTQQDLVFAKEKLRLKTGASFSDSGIDGKVKESMVMMAALAQESEKTATPEELVAVSAKVKRYREELMAELYLKKNASVTAPTISESLAYYERNKEFFGERTIRQIEIIRVVKQPNEVELEGVLAALTKVKKQSDWAAAVKKTVANSLEYVEASTGVEQLHPMLRRVANGLNEGQTSNIVYIDKVPQIVRVKKLLAVKAKPFEEVKEEISNTLAEKKLRQEIKALSDTLVNKAEVVYLEK